MAVDGSQVESHVALEVIPGASAKAIIFDEAYALADYASVASEPELVVARGHIRHLFKKLLSLRDVSVIFEQESLKYFFDEICSEAISNPHQYLDPGFRASVLRDHAGEAFRIVSVLRARVFELWEEAKNRPRPLVETFNQAVSDRLRLMIRSKVSAEVRSNGSDRTLAFQLQDYLPRTPPRVGSRKDVQDWFDTFTKHDLNVVRTSLMKNLLREALDLFPEARKNMDTPTKGTVMDSTLPVGFSRTIVTAPVTKKDLLMVPVDGERTSISHGSTDAVASTNVVLEESKSSVEDLKTIQADNLKIELEEERKEAALAFVPDAPPVVLQQPEGASGVSQTAEEKGEAVFHSQVFDEKMQKFSDVTVEWFTLIWKSNIYSLLAQQNVVWAEAFKRETEHLKALREYRQIHEIYRVLRKSNVQFISKRRMLQICEEILQHAELEEARNENVASMGAMVMEVDRSSMTPDQRRYHETAQQVFAEVQKNHYAVISQGDLSSRYQFVRLAQIKMRSLERERDARARMAWVFHDDADVRSFLEHLSRTNPRVDKRLLEQESDVIIGEIQKVLEQRIDQSPLGKVIRAYFGTNLQREQLQEMGLLEDLSIRVDMTDLPPDESERKIAAALDPILSLSGKKVMGALQAIHRAFKLVEVHCLFAFHCAAQRGMFDERLQKARSTAGQSTEPIQKAVIERFFVDFFSKLIEMMAVAENMKSKALDAQVDCELGNLFDILVPGSAHKDEFMSILAASNTSSNAPPFTSVSRGAFRKYMEGFSISMTDRVLKILRGVHPASYEVLCERDEKKLPLSVHEFRATAAKNLLSTMIIGPEPKISAAKPSIPSSKLGSYSEANVDQAQAPEILLASSSALRVEMVRKELEGGARFELFSVPEVSKFSPERQILVARIFAEIPLIFCEALKRIMHPEVVEVPGRHQHAHLEASRVCSDMSLFRAVTCDEESEDVNFVRRFWTEFRDHILPVAVEEFLQAHASLIPPNAK